MTVLTLSVLPLTNVKVLVETAGSNVIAVPPPPDESIFSRPDGQRYIEPTLKRRRITSTSSQTTLPRLRISTYVVEDDKKVLKAEVVLMVEIASLQKLTVVYRTPLKRLC